MSRKRVIKALTSLGLTTKDIEVYVFLAREGPHEAHSIAESLRMGDQEIVNRLDVLERKGIVKKMGKIVPERFFSVPFEKAVDLLVEANLKAVEVAEKNKKETLIFWDSMLKENIEDNQ